MIRYTLVCEKEHGFDGWFRSSADFDDQAAAGAVSCPVCGSTGVQKGLMAPSVAVHEEGAPAPEKLRVAAPDPRQTALVEMMRQIRRTVTENAENVGDRFAEEARRIHFEEAEKRGIYGEATPDEAKALAEDGIDFFPLPVLPEDGN